MMHRLIVSAIFAGAVLMGCGGVETTTNVEVFTNVSSALSTCSTTCGDGTTRSCQGTTCSALDGQFVQCNGLYYYCPTCKVITGSSYDSYEEACSAAYQESISYCEARGGVKSISKLCRLNSTTPPYMGQYNVCCNGTL